MEERVLVTGEPVNLKKIFTVVATIIVILFMFVNISDVGMNPLIMLFEGYTLFEVISVLVLSIVGALLSSSILCILLFIVYKIFSKMSIVVTDKRVYGTSYFGKRVDLPFDSITAVSTGWFSGVCVSTASGVIRFLCLKNSNVIYDVINSLLIQRQNKGVVKQEVGPNAEIKFSTIDVTEEVRKYKALLDDEIITKKEFEDKKKELLNLK